MQKKKWKNPNQMQMISDLVQVGSGFIQIAYFSHWSSYMIYGALFIVGGKKATGFVNFLVLDIELLHLSVC